MTQQNEYAPRISTWNRIWEHSLMQPVAVAIAVAVFVGFIAFCSFMWLVERIRSAGAWLKDRALLALLLVVGDDESHR